MRRRRRAAAEASRAGVISALLRVLLVMALAAGIPALLVLAKGAGTRADRHAALSWHASESHDRMFVRRGCG